MGVKAIAPVAEERESEAKLARRARLWKSRRVQGRSRFMAVEISEIAIDMRTATGTMSFADKSTGATGSLKVNVPKSQALTSAQMEQIVRTTVQRVLQQLRRVEKR
jgi:hypothetical protein